MNEPPKPPSGLRAPGRAFWAEIVAEFIPSPGELEILRQAARTVDEADRLERELRRQPMTVRGYNGQLAANPLYRVLQEHRALIRKLVDSLNIPDATEEAGMTARQRHAQHAARVRWAREAG